MIESAALYSTTSLKRGFSVFVLSVWSVSDCTCRESDTVGRGVESVATPILTIASRESDTVGRGAIKAESAADKLSLTDAGRLTGWWTSLTTGPGVLS